MNCPKCNYWDTLHYPPSVNWCRKCFYNWDATPPKPNCLENDRSEIVSANFKHVTNGNILGPLKWHGGKHYLASKIIALMPTHLHYVEPFFGGGAVLLAKNPNNISEVVNDLDGNLINFWNVIASESYFLQFQRLIQAVPFSEFHWNNSKNYENSIYQVDRAVQFFVHCRQSLAGRMDSFGPLSRNRTRRGMNEQVSAWLTTVDGLPEVHKRLKRVAIVGPKDAKEVISQQDGGNTLFYLDPPYLKETRSSPDVYRFEMSNQEHSDLLELINSVKGKVMISGYNSDLYMEKLKNWNVHSFAVPNNAAKGNIKRTMLEMLWCNF